MEALIYDFETLSQNQYNCVVVNIAAMNYTEDRFLTNPYEYDELVEMCNTLKFDVQEQVEKYGRHIQKSTLDWWKKQSKEAQKCLIPSDEDVSITELYDFMVKHKAATVDKIFTRSNTFDPIIVQTLLHDIGMKDPAPWWTIRDTRSFLDGLLYGSDISNKFIPEDVKDKFIGHDSRHDIAMDVYRMQHVVRIVHGKD